MIRYIAAAVAATIALGLPAGTRLPGGELERPTSITVEVAPLEESSPARAYEATPLEHSIPVEVRIPSLDIAAEVLPVGITSDAEMEVPDDIADVGWYTPTAPVTFDAGSTVLVGHRDGTQNPNGVFRNLETLREDRVITVTDSDGARHRFWVESVTSLPDETFAQRASQYFVSDGPPRLILLTCGGDYVREEGGYQSTVVVIATPFDRSGASR